MKTLHGLMLVVLAAQSSLAFPCTPSDRKSCPKAPGSFSSTEQIPQFITITWDDSINPFSYSLVQDIVGGFKQRNHCPVPSTFFISTKDTVAAAVQALYLAGNEIASHTINHIGNPPADEIVGARTWLAESTGIPAEKINGFRAPFLLHSPDTRATLAANGFLYDSSISDNMPSEVSPSVGERTWPYTMDDGIPQACSTGTCNADERYKGLWEIPLWAVVDENQQPIASMDPSGNAFDNYRRELDWRMSGNRAPLGLFFHAGLQSEPTRVAELRQFIEYALSLPDVWFVTNQQLLAWMQNPVPASRVAKQLKCHKPTDISPDVGAVCETYVGNCEFGSFNSTACKCDCMGEGTPGGYCPDSTGACTVVCA